MNNVNGLKWSTLVGKLFEGPRELDYVARRILTDEERAEFYADDEIRLWIEAKR